MKKIFFLIFNVLAACYCFGQQGTPINNGFNVNIGRAIDMRQGKIVTGRTVPYATTTEANTAVVSPFRYKGLTALVTVGGATKEYWWKDDTTNAALIYKGFIDSVWVASDTLRVLKNGVTYKFPYISSATASNGLTKTGNDFRLGGNLTGETIVNTTNGALIFEKGTTDLFYAPGYVYIPNTDYSNDTSYNVLLAAGTTGRILKSHRSNFGRPWGVGETYEDGSVALNGDFLFGSNGEILWGGANQYTIAANNISLQNIASTANISVTNGVGIQLTGSALQNTADTSYKILVRNSAGRVYDRYSATFGSGGGGGSADSGVWKNDVVFTGNRLIDGARKTWQIGGVSDTNTAFHSVGIRTNHGFSIADLEGGTIATSGKNWSLTGLGAGTFGFVDSLMFNSDLIKFNSNQMVLNSSGYVGIGTVSPNQKLHVVGNIQMVDGAQGLKKVMQSNANGMGAWGLVIDTGTYTPTLTGVANVNASTAYPLNWYRVGNTVTVAGRVNIEAATALLLTTLRVSLPIASNFTDANQAGGSGSCDATQATFAVKSDATNDNLLISFNVGNIDNAAFYFTATYKIF